MVAELTVVFSFFPKIYNVSTMLGRDPFFAVSKISTVLLIVHMLCWLRSRYSENF